MASDRPPSSRVCPAGRNSTSRRCRSGLRQSSRYSGKPLKKKRGLIGPTPPTPAPPLCRIQAPLPIKIYSFAMGLPSPMISVRAGSGRERGGPIRPRFSFVRTADQREDCPSPERRSREVEFRPAGCACKGSGRSNVSLPLPGRSRTEPLFQAVFFAHFFQCVDLANAAGVSCCTESFQAILDDAFHGLGGRDQELARIKL